MCMFEQQAPVSKGPTVRISPGRQAIAAEMGSLAASLQALAAPVPTAERTHDQPASVSASGGAVQQPASSPSG